MEAHRPRMSQTMMRSQLFGPPRGRN